MYTACLIGYGYWGSKLARNFHGSELFELTAIAFAVVGGVSLTGGRGSPYRAFLGTLVMGGLFNLFSMWGLNTWHRNIVVGIIIILVVVLDQRKYKFGRI